MSNELMSAFDIRGTEATGLTIECAWNVGKALAEYLPTSGGVCVVAVQGRESLARGAIEGLRLQGRPVLDAKAGGRDLALSLIRTTGLSGAVIIDDDELDAVTTIALYQEEPRLIGHESGLVEICALIEAGNFVPAAVKGELTILV